MISPDASKISCIFAPFKGFPVSLSTFLISILVSSSNISTIGISATVMFPDIVKYTFSASIYPSGARVSIRTYSPSVRHSSSCGTSVEIQLSITSPSIRITVPSLSTISVTLRTSKLAPGSSSFVVSCFLEMITLLGLSAASY